MKWRHDPPGQVGGRAEAEVTSSGWWFTPTAVVPMVDSFLIGIFYFRATLYVGPNLAFAGPADETRPKRHHRPETALR